MTRDEHLRLAKETVESTIVWSGPSWRTATEHMVAAKALRASQRQIAKAVGMSSAWVHAMLKWGAGGYKGTPFGPSSKANRQRARAGQAADQWAGQSGAGKDQEQAAAAHARAKTAKAEAAKAKADAAKATAEVRRAKAEALKAKAEAARAEAEARTARARSNNRNKQTVHSGSRALLVKALGMLGSDHAGERANAARVVEKQRAKLSMTWDELIVRERDDHSDQIDSDGDHKGTKCEDEEAVA